MITKSSEKSTKSTLTLEAAQRRSVTWQLLHEAGAPLLWHPIAIDKILNASEAKPIRSLADAIDAAIKGEPTLPDGAERLTEFLKGRVENCPLWKGFIRRAAVQFMPASFRKETGLIDSCEGIVWDEVVRIEGSYIPIGIGDGGELRPHYYNNFLRHCLRNSARKVVQFCFEAVGKRIDDPDDQTQFADPAEPLPGTNVEHEECRSTLSKALRKILRDAVMRNIFELLVVRGLSLREAEIFGGRGKSSIQREARMLAEHLQNAFCEHYGLPTKGAPDAAAIIAAIRTMLGDGLQIPGFAIPAPVSGKVIPFPTPDSALPDQCA